MEELAISLSREKTAPCYLILSDGTSATVVEKDLYDGKIRSSDEFIVHTNNDTLTDSAQNPMDIKETPSMLNILDEIGMDAFLKDSKERSACVQKKWNALKSRQKKKQQAGLGKEKDLIGASVREETLIGWVRKYPTMNGESHFGCVMDPKKGEIRWLARGMCWLSKESLMQTKEKEEMDVSD